MYTSTDRYDIGIVVDAGPTIGYGHAVRSVRLARRLGMEHHVVFHPLSEPCREFIDASGFATTDISEFPPLVITDLRETHGITAKIHRQGSRHISIHDLGLAQCQSDVVIDGAITRLFPYPKDRGRELYVGPQYMITRDPVARVKTADTVLVTFGGGTTAEFAQRISEQLYRLGLTVVSTTGFSGSSPMDEDQLRKTMSTCRFAISASGTSLYDLLASGIPTIAVAFDRLQLRTADAFHELGAVLSAGLIEKLTPGKILNHIAELLDNRSLVHRLTQAGQMLVDGKGLPRVVEIVRRQIWLTSQAKTYMTC